MADENPEQCQADELPEDRAVASSSGDQASDSVEPSLSRNVSLSRLNAQAPEFVPRTPPAGHGSGRMEPRMVQIHPAPPPLPVMRIFQAPPPPAFHSIPPVQNQFEYYGGSGGGYREPEMGRSRSPSDPDPASASASAATDVLSDDIIQKITNQVTLRFPHKFTMFFTEYFFEFYTSCKICFLVSSISEVTSWESKSFRVSKVRNVHQSKF